MAEIRSFPFVRHLRSDASSHVLHTRRARLIHSGRGLSFLFRPMTDSLAEVPVEDRELTFVFHGRTRDFQDLGGQVAVVYRVVDPEVLAQRIDFTVDLRTGAYLKKPLEKLSGLLAQLVDQHAADVVNGSSIQDMLATGVVRLRERLEGSLLGDAGLASMGLEVLAVRVTAVKPNPELEKALEAPMREHIKQEADEAAFQRRALAVEKELAIQENELQNRIELAKREEQLIQQVQANTRRKAQESAEASRIAADAEAARARITAETTAHGIRVEGEAQAGQIRLVEGARTEQERAKLEAYKTLPPSILLALAAREFAGKLHTIEHLNLTPDLLTPLLGNLLQAGTSRLEAGS
ncbi:MAG: band 7 protein [Holophaga sp.]|nr:band 7 protein [Holophaga sp.]